jgi:DNA segregation ATPase FtsK/SpoIIIE-like protein
MKFVMVDPKKVEFPVYNPINHLMCLLYLMLTRQLSL